MEATRVYWKPVWHVIRSRFVLRGLIQELRDLIHTRKRLIREMVQHKQRIQKVLEDTNVKLLRWCQTMFGDSGRRMLKRSSPATTDADKLAALGQ
jgi:tRNA isopentenyl-2-thiomethyl-A-37 hydroxylase MiaE